MVFKVIVILFPFFLMSYYVIGSVCQSGRRHKRHECHCGGPQTIGEPAGIDASATEPWQHGGNDRNVREIPGSVPSPRQ